MKPHKHADVIKAWADGHKVQFRESELEEWKDCQRPWPFWDANFYRIKPKKKEPVVRWLWVGKGGRMSANMYTENERLEMKGLLNLSIKLEWSRTEFDE